MTEPGTAFQISPHSHVFLGEDHARAERRTWAVIILCLVMMVAEIVGGVLFGSLALIADGLHMSTHAGALLLAALAYTFARRYASDAGFTFGTGKFGDLAGYSSAIVLAMIALLIAYEAITRFFDPVRSLSMRRSRSPHSGCWSMSSAPGYWPAVIITATTILTATPTPTIMTTTITMTTPLTIAPTRSTIATTICVPPSFTSWRMPRSRCSSSSACCWRAPSAGSGWIRSPASSARW